jgi:hypothetical protein
MAVCQKQLDFGRVSNLDVVADLEGGDITSDAGGLLLKEIDAEAGITETAARCLFEDRASNKTKHTLSDLLRQRVYQIALGYEDQNDADTMRRDPSLKTMTGRKPQSDPDLGSQPTLSRFENKRTRKEVHRLSDALVKLYIRLHPGPRRTIVLDIDGTDDPTHGQQAFTFFHGFYGHYMYHPLFIFDGENGFPLAALLRRGNAHAGFRSVSLLKRVIKRLKKAYPGVVIILRADAGFALPELYAFCEAEGIYYTIGLITNDRLRAEVSDLAAGLEQRFEQTGQKQREFTTFRYKAGSWPRRRRVVAKVERLERGLNQRFVVTNLDLDAHVIYDRFYVRRGEAENRIKELKNQLKADRLSCSRFMANQFRLLLHTLAYCLFLELRQRLIDTEPETAQVDTIRLKLLKIGARVRQTSRKIWFHMASGYPYRDLLATLLNRIRTASAESG